MDKWKEAKGSVAVIVILLLVILGSGGAIAYSLNSKNSFFTQVDVKNKTIPFATNEILTKDEPASSSQNLTKEFVPTPTNTPTPTPLPTPTNKPTTAPSNTSSGLNLTVEARAGGALMKWTGDSSNGFKACFSEHENPAYPADNCTYKNANDRSHEIGGLTGGKTYHFRVGVYGTDGKVSTYSGDVAATPSNSTQSSTSSNTSLTLTAVSEESGKVKVSWTLNGDPINGFKEVWSVDENPTYPEDHWNYDADTNLRSYTWSGLTSGQTLHFRVGVYKSGQGVTTYSNDVTVTVK